jgi:predicted 2-oxoglutarate/Fe(II)-dependent dioxygenase YbiX
LFALKVDWSNAARSKTNAADAPGGSTINLAFRDSRDVYPPDEWIDTTVAVYQHVQDYLARWYPDRYAAPTSALVLRYTEGGRLGLHNDLSYNETRRLTSVLYLNDAYTGGEIEFPKQGLKIKPKPGELLIFPAGPGHPHQVHPVTAGERLCLQSFWIIP